MNILPPKEERAKVIFTGERARDILYGDESTYRVIRDKIVDKSRWSIRHSLVIQRVEDSRFFQGYYSVGATEYQDESPWGYDNAEFTEVFPVEKIVIDYR